MEWLTSETRFGDGKEMRTFRFVPFVFLGCRLRCLFSIAELVSCCDRRGHDEFTMVKSQRGQERDA